MNGDRLLLCRPQGGLNDMLCQIERARLYAEHFGRTVVVDTNYAHSRYFRDEFSNYFVSCDRKLLLSPAEAPGCLDETDVFPAFLKGRLRGYDTRYDMQIWNHVDADTGERVSFNFEQDYAERLIVHHADGGGSLSMGTLARLRLHEDLRQELLRRRALAGPRYSAVHVRHTDYRAGYEALTPDRIDPIDPLFVATDSPEPVAYFRDLIGADRVLTFASLPDQGGWPLHVACDPKDARERNRDAILDLLMLALAARLYVIELKENSNRAKYSGYSLLAASLRDDPELLARLIAPEETPRNTYSLRFNLKLPYSG